jgi:signal transduction histidine kinase
VRCTRRQSGLAAALLAEILLPFSFPVFGPQTNLENRPGPQVPDVAIALDVVWIWLLVWSVADALSHRAALGTLDRKRTLAGTIAGVVVAMLADRLIWPDLSVASSSMAKAHHAALVHAVIAVAVSVPATLAYQAFAKLERGRRIPLYRLVCAVCVCLLLAPPFMKFAKMGPLILFALASCLDWLSIVSGHEGRTPGRKWRARALLFGGAAAVFAGSQLVVARIFDPTETARHVHRFPDVLFYGLSFFAIFSSLGLALVVACLSIADALALAMRKTKSVRSRMLVLSFVCSALAFLLGHVAFDGALRALGATLRPDVRASLELVLLGLSVYIFSLATANELAIPLERLILAVSEIGKGNIDVELDDSGRDEVAAVARGVNRVVGLLRQSTFLETINADLRARSDLLTQTLESLKNAQAELVRAERMASVATLVKGIAHELNNPINYIAGNVAPLRRYTDFLMRVARSLSDGTERSSDEIRQLVRLTEHKDLAYVCDDLARLVSDIEEGARRARLIVSDLQSLTSASQRGVEYVDLHRIARQTRSLLGPGIPPGVSLDVELAPVSPVVARAGQIEQVLINLTDNALRAVAAGGNVRIWVGGDAREAVVKVTDDGPGMSEDVRRQAFEPFFTTRTAGEGSGLGLAIVASIVRAHGGNVSIRSALGSGTEVELRIPLASDLLEHPAIAPTF